jgi:hypothetical protein
MHCIERGFLEYLEVLQTHNWVSLWDGDPEDFKKIEINRLNLSSRDAARLSLSESHDISVGISAHQYGTTVRLDSQACHTRENIWVLEIPASPARPVSPNHQTVAI